MICLIDISDFDESLFEKVRNAENIISLSEKDRKVKNPSYVGRVLLGYVLKRKYGLDSFRISYGETEKPYLENENIFFNISHSGKYVLCCVEGFEVGCDIQIATPYNSNIARRYFTEKEYELFENAADKDSLFTKLWTMKESILKKEGCGISGGLSTYDFSAYVNERCFEAHGNMFYCFEMDDAHMCVCSEKLLKEIERVSKEDFKNYIDSIRQ